MKGYLHPHFQATSDAHQLKLQEQVLRFESTLRMVLTEEALFELKQGFCQLTDPSIFDDISFAKMLRTASAMANARPGATGQILLVSRMMIRMPQQ